LLFLANTMAFVDRQALALLVQPIKRDLQVSDTAMSMLYGLSFTLFYVLVGIPIARLADRSNRRTIIAVSVLVWSVATATCGLARSYTALFAARIGVGAGEAGLSPAAYSLLADYFPKERLATAMGVYTMGTYVGGALALLIGGLVSTLVPPSAVVVVPLIGAIKGWQLIFLALGGPGLLLAAAMRLIREPVRRGTGVDVQVAPLSAFFAYIGRRKQAYLGIGIGFALMIFVGNGTGAWIPAFFERHFGWTTAEIGRRYGLTVFFCGTAGALAGGLVASWLQRSGAKHGNLVAATIGFAVLIPLTIGFPLVGNAYLALTLIGAMNFFAGFNFGGGLASLQNLTPNRMRALLSAGYMLTVNIIGGVLGPMTVALITDHIFHDPAKLHLAIAMSCAVASPLALACLLIGARGVRAADALVEP